MVQFSNQEMIVMHFVYVMTLGRPASVRTIQIEDDVLNRIEEDPTTSTRKIAYQLNLNHVTVWQIWKYQQLCPYHLHVQAPLILSFAYNS
ncbi:unnamed protein product [Acanthoscelides obtectus]|uniref:Uncharacterized protein n=1 Tax=Acanthoscelides obtectus TaxID=200917 RepID=A0A9P0KJD8_ACAOB|nr:unnamed protein product [Acanthoscelides obtectus]CAH2019536.1 unnamed protein product [Acanthoscelides obtectus]CAK1625608.1 hypothetical protein AOBTE_LOCUS3268 [Acanthoscelides obtectus]CAK1689318.1 hypothetical protein AOBTE_LOCUS37162 [Acanthoscelides obtectus]